MEEEEKFIALEHAIFKRLRSLGIELYDDAGNRMKPGGPEEIRVLRSLAQVVCQTPAVRSLPDEKACCADENRTLDGGCANCGDPSL